MFFYMLFNCSKEELNFVGWSTTTTTTLIYWFYIQAVPYHRDVYLYHVMTIYRVTGRLVSNRSATIQH